MYSAMLWCEGSNFLQRGEMDTWEPLMSFQSGTYLFQLLNWKVFAKYLSKLQYIIVFLACSLLLSCGLIRNKRERKSGGREGLEQDRKWNADKDKC